MTRDPRRKSANQLTICVTKRNSPPGWRRPLSLSWRQPGIVTATRCLFPPLNWQFLRCFFARFSIVIPTDRFVFSCVSFTEMIRDEPVLPHANLCRPCTSQTHTHTETNTFLQKRKNIAGPILFYTGLEHWTAKGMGHCEMVERSRWNVLYSLGAMIVRISIDLVLRGVEKSIKSIHLALFSVWSLIVELWSNSLRSCCYRLFIAFGTFLYFVKKNMFLLFKPNKTKQISYIQPEHCFKPRINCKSDT